MRVIEGEFSQERWDKKKIAIGLVIIAALIFGGYKAKSIYLDKGKNSSAARVGGSSSSDVAGTSVNSQEQQGGTKDVSGAATGKVNVQEELQKKLETVKEQVNNLNVSDLATSSPQLQKLVNDLQSLQNLPKNQAKDACFNICKNFQ